MPFPGRSGAMANPSTLVVANWGSENVSVVDLEALQEIDEIPMAYKDIDAVMQAQQDLVEVVHTLKQVVCVKG